VEIGTPQQASATVLWYAGDVSGIAAADVQYPGGGQFLYDDFVLGSASTVGGFFGNYWLGSQASFTNQATWELRSGAGPGDGGTLLASGTDPATMTATGNTNSQLNLAEYTLTLTGLSVNLPAGTYWLGLFPVTDSCTGCANLSASLTTGTNEIGPASPTSYYLVTGIPYFGTVDDARLQFGVTDTAAAPEPATGTLLLGGLLALAWRARS